MKSSAIEPPKTILLTGANGLLGTQLCIDILQAGFRLKSLLRHDSDTRWLKQRFEDAFGEGWKKKWQQVSWCVGDVLDIGSLEKAMEGTDLVIHAAAVVSFHPKDAPSMWKVNAEGTANVVNVALASDARELIHVSSIAALGRSENNKMINETVDWKNDPRHSTYARTKYMAEQEAWRGMAEGLTVSVVNPGVIIGPGDPERSSTAVFKEVEDGLKYYSSGANGFVDVRDVGKVVLQLAKTPKNGERYILVGENASYKTYLHEIADALEKPKPSKNPSKKAAIWLSRLLWLREKLTGIRAFITRQSVQSAYADFSYDPRKSEHTFDLDYRSLRESVQWTAKQLKC